MREQFFENEQENNDSIFPSLTFKERLIAFVFLNLLGYLLQFGSFFRLISSTIRGSPESFGFSYSIGNILSVLGTIILIGVKKQIQNVTHQKRREISAIFFGSLILSIITPIMFKNPLGTLFTVIFILIQMISYWVYTLSYLPWARQMLRNCCRCVFESIFNKQIILRIFFLLQQFKKVQKLSYKDVIK